MSMVSCKRCEVRPAVIRSTGAVIDKYGRYGLGDGPIVYNNLECFGHENTIAKCQKTVYPNFYCSANRIIGIRCLDSKLTRDRSLPNNYVFVL